jgi:hypothetical protein
LDPRTEECESEHGAEGEWGHRMQTQDGPTV